MSANISGNGGDLMDTQTIRNIKAMTNIPADQVIRTVDANVEAGQSLYPHVPSLSSLTQTSQSLATRLCLEGDFPSRLCLLVTDRCNHCG
jgi:hypothetical protein